TSPPTSFSRSRAGHSRPMQSEAPSAIRRCRTCRPRRRPVFRNSRRRPGTPCLRPRGRGSRSSASSPTRSTRRSMTRLRRSACSASAAKFRTRPGAVNSLSRRWSKTRSRAGRRSSKRRLSRRSKQACGPHPPRGDRDEPSRRRFLHLAVGAAALPAVSRVARAQAYPTRPVRIVLGFAAGGSTDIGARLIGQWLHERLGQPFVIENRPGAGTNIATETVVRAPADGYTLLMVGPSSAVNATLYDKLDFVFLRDIAPVASLIRQPQVMLANPSLTAQTVPELIAYAKANPGKITMASAGVGSAGHLVGELFKLMAGVDFVHVP